MYLNTTSGLAPALDTIGQILATRQQDDAQMRGLAAAGVAGLTPADAPKGILSGLFGGAGPSPAPAAPVAVPSQVPAIAATPRADTLPSFAAAGGVSPNVQQALAYFQDKGLSPIAAQGLVGNFMRESGGKLDPNAVNPTGGATGIAQWLGPRAQGLQQFAKAAGRPLNDLRTQLDYAWSELSGPEKATLAALQKATNPLQAAVAGIGYERPEGWSASNPIGAKDFSKRLAATAGLAGMPAEALAFSPQAGGTPGSQAVASATGGGSPMPVATADGATATQPGANVDFKELIKNPATRALGIQLWQQSVSPKDGFTLKEGEQRFDSRGRPIASVAPAAPKQEHVDFNGRALSFDPKSGTYRDATPANLPQGFRPATAAERQQFGVGPTTPFFFGPDGKPATLQGGTQVTVNNAVNPILKGLGDQFVEGAQGARDAADTVRSVQNARTQLQGGIVAGFGAEQQLGLRKLGAALGVGDPAKIVNTETFLTQVKPLVLSTVKGLGAGSGISNADRDFALAAVGGSIKLEANTIARVLDITERAARAKIDRHNTLADQMISKQPELGQVGPMLRITPPEGAPQAAPAAPQPAAQDMSPLGQAKAAIAAGAPRDKVIQRLQQQGIDASGTGL